MSAGHFVKSLLVGVSLASVIGTCVAAGGLALAATAAATAFWMPMLIVSGGVWGAGLIGQHLLGGIRKGEPPHLLPTLLGAGVMGAFLFSFGGTAHDATQNRHKVLSESKALVAKFEHAVKRSPEQGHQPLPRVTPTHESQQPNGGWIGQAPWAPPVKK